MKGFQKSSLIIITLFFVSCNQLKEKSVTINGLDAPVEIFRDKWGINHIYAQNQKDLFFAQGYAAAKDRLFQFEIWRRQATGTVAEILGERELQRDIGTRLFMFRGDMKEEMNHYHEDGEEIITSYVAGVNAYIDEIMQTPDELPLPFKLTGLAPQKWTPEVVISRHQGLLGNIGYELRIGRAVAATDPGTVQKYTWFHPKEPDLTIDPKIDKELLFQDVLGPYFAYRRSVKFQPEDIVPEGAAANPDELLALLNSPRTDYREIDWTAIGSNNWVISGDLTESGNAIMANDPHRSIAAPSLRYMAHLVAPGWNVIGGGEPEIPGISIGHNEYGAWGLTVYRTDGEDLYVYDLNPDNLNQYRYKDEWVDMKVITENIKVKGSEDVTVDLRYTRHGPVTFIDSVNAVGFAVRCAWLETGGSPYLASLRMDQAKTWEEFRQACNYSNIPGENMVWADKDGNIGWQAVGIAPIRRNFSGLVPVPGDGTYEWDGYLPIIEKPSIFNPEEGFFATANENVTPHDYDKWDAIGFSWSDPFRGIRIREVLSSGEKLTMEDMKSLQTDYHSVAARHLIEFLNSTGTLDELAKSLKTSMKIWDLNLNPNSVQAAIYVAWENKLKAEAKKLYLPTKMQPFYTPQLWQIIDWMRNYEEFVGARVDRDAFIINTFTDAVYELTEKLGPEPGTWIYGQENFKHVLIKHPLSGALNDSLRSVFEVGPFPRGGNSYTPGSTGPNLNQSSGASFRMIVDTGDWDKAVGTNAPGQSGDPESPFYRNLAETWANDEYFPVYYSQQKIKANSVEKLVLSPN